MDRRTILAVFLSLSIYYSWMMIRGDVPVDELVEGETPTTEAVENTAVEAAPAPTATAQPTFSAPVLDIAFENCNYKGQISTDGGGIHSLVLTDQTAPYNVTPIYAWAFSGFAGPWQPYGEATGPEEVITEVGQVLAPGVGDLAAAPVRMEVVQEGAHQLKLRGATSQGVTIEHNYSWGTDDCLMAVNTTWRNDSGNQIDQAIWVAAYDHIDAGGGMMARYQNAHRAQIHADGDVEEGTWDIDVPTPVELEGEVGWFGLGDRYFSMLMTPSASPIARAAWSSRGPGEDALRGVHYTVAPSLTPGQSVTTSMSGYIGPLDLTALAEVSEEAQDSVDFGIFAFFSYPLLSLLKYLYSVTGNWGWAIISLTIIVKTLFFPLTQTAFKSGQAMQAIQPKLAKIKEEHADNQEEQSRRTMELFKEHGVNPLGGCLPMVVQMPVWFALYSVLLYSVELYHTEFFYLKDLSSPDPYCVLPAIVVVLMLIQQQFTPTGNMDPAQARMMKFMPLMFGFFFFTFPSGLVVYIFVNMVLSIAQQWYIKRSFNPIPPEPAAA